MWLQESPRDRADARVRKRVDATETGAIEWVGFGIDIDIDATDGPIIAY